MTYLKAKNSIYCEIGEIIFVLRENFGRKSSASDIEKIVAKFGGV
jgi:hypothetical protein